MVFKLGWDIWNNLLSFLFFKVMLLNKGHYRQNLVDFQHKLPNPINMPWASEPDNNVLFYATGLLLFMAREY